jgi:hypothetical protein
VVGKREVCRFLSSEEQTQILRRFAPLDDSALGEWEWCSEPIDECIGECIGVFSPDEVGRSTAVNWHRPIYGI